MTKTKEYIKQKNSFNNNNNKMKLFCSSSSNQGS